MEGYDIESFLKETRDDGNKGWESILHKFISKTDIEERIYKSMCEKKPYEENILGVKLKDSEGGVKYGRIGMYNTEEGMNIVNVDFVSFYQHILINYRINPRNTDRKKFVLKLKELISMKESTTDNTEKKEIKKLLSTITGKFNQENNVLYDKEAFSDMVNIGKIIMTRMLTMLDEKGRTFLPLAMNTDSMMIMMYHSDRKRFDEVVEAICEKYKLKIKVDEVERTLVKSSNDSIEFVMKSKKEDSDIYIEKNVIERKKYTARNRGEFILRNKDGMYIGKNILITYWLAFNEMPTEEIYDKIVERYKIEVNYKKDKEEAIESIKKITIIIED